MKTAMPTRVIAGASLCLALLGLGACAEDPMVRIDGPAAERRLEVHVEVLREARERRRGLAGRQSLSRDTGVLLVAPIEDELCITNADVAFGIDAVFVDEARRVVRRSTLSAGDGQLVCARALAVLEVAAGVAAQVESGDIMHAMGFALSGVE